MRVRPDLALPGGRGTQAPVSPLLASRRPRQGGQTGASKPVPSCGPQACSVATDLSACTHGGSARGAGPFPRCR